MPFAFYKRLTAAQKRVYERSDELHEVPLPTAALLRPRVDALRAALEADKLRAVSDAGVALVNDLTAALKTERVELTVHSRRPKNRAGELYGYYTLEEGKPGHIEIWMRTAANGNVVAFKTFLRTLLHEVCHHLDFKLFALSETYHTEGFLRRESSLMRQLLPAELRRRGRPARPARTREGAVAEHAPDAQPLLGPAREHEALPAKPAAPQPAGLAAWRAARDALSAATGGSRPAREHEPRPTSATPSPATATATALPTAAAPVAPVSLFALSNDPTPRTPRRARAPKPLLHSAHPAPRRKPEQLALLGIA